MKDENPCMEWSLKEICECMWDLNNHPENEGMKNAWFESEIPALGFRKPVDLLKSPKGTREIKTCLLRAIYGVYS